MGEEGLDGLGVPHGDSHFLGDLWSKEEEQQCIFLDLKLSHRGTEKDLGAVIYSSRGTIKNIIRISLFEFIILISPFHPIYKA